MTSTLSAIPPAVRYRVLDAVAQLDHGDDAAVRFAQLLESAGSWLGADPALAEVGHGLIEPRRTIDVRRAGCDWLARFPTVESIEKLAAVALDPATPAPVRDRAISALADRQLRARHASTQWSAEALQLADDALFKIADAATSSGRIAHWLALALRHVQSDGLAAVFARAPSLWGNALECFATAPLARVLFVSIDDIQPVHRVRVLRLVAATLGDDSVPLLLARSSTHGATADERLESLFLAVTFGGEAHLARLDEALRDQPHAEFHRKRARWHLTNRGVVPTVRGLRIARRTAVLAASERAAKCGQAADDLGALAKFARHPEPEIYELWGWMVRGAGDPVRARELVVAHRSSQPLVNELYLQDLARRGRVKQLLAAAQATPDLGALALAIWGRPLAALELAATASVHTPELSCARVLACLRAGRPDLADQLLAEDPPPIEVADDEAPAEFPGPNERWLAEHAAATQPAIAALVRGKDGVLALAQPADPDADPDVASLAPIVAVVRRLDRTLRGKFVCVAGELKPAERAAIASIIERTGARVVAGPIPGVDFYIAGEYAARMIAQLARQGARRLRPEEIEGL
ncbi:MAG: hypothetical protein H0V17_01870 [Deltaproteobacteria bacterium]|nr:hypothetical protein [Deltaproteobacteria bacterium]